jgi:hypothetical protein
MRSIRTAFGVTFCVAVIGALLVALPADAASTCHPRHTRHVKQIGPVNTFYTNRALHSPTGKRFDENSYVACNELVGLWVLLSYSDYQAPGPEPLRIGGPYVAFGDAGVGSGDDQDLYLKLVDSRNGRVLLDKLIYSSDEDDGQSITRLNVSNTGVVSWSYSGRWHGHGTSKFIAVFDSRGFRILDRGRTVRVNTMVRRGSYVSWRHGKENRSAFVS